MVPQNLRFGGGVSGTVFNPAVAAIVILVGVLMCCLPQRKVIVPFLLTSLLIPSDQILVVAGLHFPLLRILIAFGMVRIFIIKGGGKWNVFSGGLNKVDKLLILLAVVNAVAGVLLFQNSRAFVFQLGDLYSVFGAYFLLRCLIRDQEDVARVIRVFALIVVALGGLMIFEHFTGWNPYALLGGAQARYFASDMDRDGRIRATASFGTPILAGFFGAVLFPLFVGLWLSDRKQRGIAALGMVGATVMTLASNSSTPAIGYLAAVLGLCIWPIRGEPADYPLGHCYRAGLSTDGYEGTCVPPHHPHRYFRSSYHRYALIDQCVRHFWSWWLVGTNANTTWGWDMWDTADQYVQAAYDGGLLGLICFTAIIVWGFKYLGRARKAVIDDKKQALFLWALGAAFFAHTISFFGITLWDQSILEWYALLAIIGAIAVPQKTSIAVRQFGTALDPGIAREPAILPAYVNRGNRLLMGHDSTHDDGPVPFHRRRAKEF